MTLKPADYSLWLSVVIVLSLAFFAANVIFFIVPLMNFIVRAREFFGAKKVATGIIGLIGTLFATFIGAWVAFKICQHPKRKRKN